MCFRTHAPCALAASHVGGDSGHSRRREALAGTGDADRPGPSIVSKVGFFATAIPSGVRGPIHRKAV